MIDLDDGYYPHTMNWFTPPGLQKRPRSLELRVRETQYKYTVYYSGGDWWEDREEMTDWCSKMFGHRNTKYNNPRWSTGPFEFRFKYEKDAAMFMLRWS